MAVVLSKQLRVAAFDDGEQSHLPQESQTHPQMDHDHAHRYQNCYVPTKDIWIVGGHHNRIEASPELLMEVVREVKRIVKVVMVLNKVLMNL